MLVMFLRLTLIAALVDCCDPNYYPALVTGLWTFSSDGMIGGRPPNGVFSEANENLCSVLDVTAMS